LTTAEMIRMELFKFAPTHVQVATKTLFMLVNLKVMLVNLKVICALQLVILFICFAILILAEIMIIKSVAEIMIIKIAIPRLPDVKAVAAGADWRRVCWAGGKDAFVARDAAALRTRTPLLSAAPGGRQLQNALEQFGRHERNAAAHPGTAVGLDLT